MANGSFVAYYRVSTRKQGQSGLGLEAQQTTVREYLNGGDWELVGELTEVESGKHSSRPKLIEALRLCRVYNAKLIIAKLDRLSRNVAFVSALMEAGVEFVAVDMPKAGKFTLHIMAAVAEQEADMIAERTRKAMQTAKARGTMLGRRDDAIAAYATKGNLVSQEVRTAGAALYIANMKPTIAHIQDKLRRERQEKGIGGDPTLREIAAYMNKKNIATPRKGGQWSATQVMRLLKAA
jgi:DNA invertase Pin-like site-specific DNA recombinase